jgi:hypothetical protein
MQKRGHCATHSQPQDLTEWSPSSHGCFAPGGRAPGLHWIGRCVGLGASQDAPFALAGNRTPIPRPFTS